MSSPDVIWKIQFTICIIHLCQCPPKMLLQIHPNFESARVSTTNASSLIQTSQIVLTTEVEFS